MKKRAVTWAILLLTFFGLADSVYLVQHEMSGTPLLCDINTLTGCNIVAQSPYAYLFGVPLAEYGLFFYGLLFMIAAFELVMFHHLVRRVMQGLALAGFLMSLYFVILQIFVINALCVYCIASALIVLFIFLLAFLLEPVRRDVVVAASVSARQPLSMPPLS